MNARKKKVFYHIEVEYEKSVQVYFLDTPFMCETHEELEQLVQWAGTYLDANINPTAEHNIRVCRCIELTNAIH